MKFAAGQLVRAKYAFEGLYYREVYTIDQPRVENPYGNLPCVTVLEMGRARLVPERALDAVYLTAEQKRECLWDWRGAKA